jgi:hypothetical protein
MDEEFGAFQTMALVYERYIVLRESHDLGWAGRDGVFRSGTGRKNTQPWV